MISGDKKEGVKMGFTLIELLLSMMIIVLLAGAAITSVFRSQAIFLFNSASQQAGAFLTEARSLAVAGKAQLDYTDYDEDGDKADEGDFVTPANYGVFFDLTDNKIFLFADLHGSGTEGIFDKPDAIAKFEDGKDFVLSIYELPDGYELLSEAADGDAVNTILYTPLFADTSFAYNATVEDMEGDFFVFGVKEKDGTRERCYAVHPVAGLPETNEFSGTECP